jgi:ABC-type multidrug transport system ATPase subunit
MKRRLTLALATIGDPKLVLLDEPTTGMDPVAKQAVWNVVRELRHGRSIIHTTHLMDEAEQLCERIIVLKNGRVVADGTPVSLKRQF